MNNSIKKIEKISVSIFGTMLEHSVDQKGSFRVVLNAVINSDEAKPLLLLGNAHRNFEDGNVIAILNPDRDLLNEMSANVGYSGSILKEIVAKRCDIMVQFWIDAYKKNASSILDSYQSKTPQASKFQVK
ncbi:MAG: hypothetical protein V3T17_03525 [Pseudomonadales bacterium]